MRKSTLTMATLQLYSSPVPVISICCIVVLCFFGLLDVYSFREWEYIPVTDMLEVLIGLGMFKKFLIVFAAIPCAAGFCTDWNSQYIRFVLIRSSIRRYIWTKYLSCAVNTFLIVFVGMVGFVLLAHTYSPLFAPNKASDIYPPFDTWAMGVFPFAYPLAQIAIFALFCAFNTSLGFVISSFIPNRYVAILSPMICSYFLEHLSIMAKFPLWVNFYALSHVSDVVGQGAGLSMAYYLSFYAVLVFMMGLLFSKQVKRRIRNEVV